MLSHARAFRWGGQDICLPYCARPHIYKVLSVSYRGRGRGWEVNKMGVLRTALKLPTMSFLRCHYSLATHYAARSAHRAYYLYLCTYSRARIVTTLYPLRANNCARSTFKHAGLLSFLRVPLLPACLCCACLAPLCMLPTLCIAMQHFTCAFLAYFFFCAFSLSSLQISLFFYTCSLPLFENRQHVREHL